MPPQQAIGTRPLLCPACVATADRALWAPDSHSGFRGQRCEHKAGGAVGWGRHCSSLPGAVTTCSCSEARGGLGCRGQCTPRGPPEAAEGARMAPGVSTPAPGARCRGFGQRAGALTQAGEDGTPSPGLLQRQPGVCLLGGPGGHPPRVLGPGPFCPAVGEPLPTAGRAPGTARQQGTLRPLADSQRHRCCHTTSSESGTGGSLPTHQLLGQESQKSPTKVRSLCKLTHHQPRKTRGPRRAGRRC